MCVMKHTPEYQEIDPNVIVPSPWNANVVNHENEEKLRASIARHGMFKPIIVREISDPALPGYETGEQYQCIGGWHRCEQAIELGYEKIPAFNLGPIDDVKAKEISLADNARYGVDDLVRLNELLEDLDLKSVEETMPWSNQDLEAMTASIAVSVDDLGDLDDLPDPDDLEDDEDDDKPAKAAKTHQMLKFRCSLEDASKISRMVKDTMLEEGFTDEDDASNAGTALAFLLLNRGDADDA